MQLAIPYDYSLQDEPYVDKEIITSVLHFLPANQRFKILEIGCGSGYFSNVLKDLSHNIEGIDTSETGIAVARKRYPNIRFEVQSAYSPQSPSSFDIIIATEVIEHLLTPKEFLRSAFLALRPGGSLILSTPYHGYLKNLLLSLTNRWDSHHAVHWDGGHIKFFSQASLVKMLGECGFENPTFHNAGRMQWLWRSIVCAAKKPTTGIEPVTY